jgi:hypothetical protein
MFAALLQQMIECLLAEQEEMLDRIKKKKLTPT